MSDKVHCDSYSSEVRIKSLIRVMYIHPVSVHLFIRGMHAVLLTIGSPTLAAYSLALAVLSNRWMVKRFQRSTHPNSYLAAQTLGNLQQVALDFPNVGPQSRYLANLRDNANWWHQLSHELDYLVPRWTFASIISVFYMVLADIITWSNLLGEPLSSVQADVTGEIISSLWL